MINRERPFSEDDAVVLERLADQVAVAVTNARLYEDAQAAAERYRQAVEDERRAREAVAQSEARYRNLFETATDAIYTLDPQGAFTSVNEATCELLGRDRADLLARSPLPFVSLERHWHGEGAVQGGAARPSRDGTSAGSFGRTAVSRLASLTNSPIRHGSQVIGILGVARDITDERERDLALERSEIRYTQLVESASDAIFTVGPVGLMTGVNRSLERASGKRRDELIGCPLSSLIDPRDRRTREDGLRAALAGESPRGQLRYTNGDGELAPLLADAHAAHRRRRSDRSARHRPRRDRRAADDRAADAAGKAGGGRRSW